MLFCTISCLEQITLSSLFPLLVVQAQTASSTSKEAVCMYVIKLQSDRTVNASLIFLRCLEARKNKRVMKVPKGTSDYQATWIVDEDDGENGDMNEESSEEDDDDDDMLDEAMEGEDEDNNSQVHMTYFCYFYNHPKFHT